MKKEAGRHISRGLNAEQLAENYLISEGFSITNRNYRTKHGEIDLIARKGQEVHFVEVKGRWSLRMGKPLEQITRRKMYRIVRAAQHYLQSHSECANLRLFFSVLGVDGTDDPPTVSWVPDAFAIPSSSRL